MPDFDPSAYLAQKTAAAAPPAFDPAKYLAEKSAPAAASPSIGARAADAVGAAGAELYSVLGGGGEPIGGHIPLIGSAGKQLGQRFRAGIGYLADQGEKPYADELDDVRAQDDAEAARFAAEHPLADYARKLVGGAGAMAIPVPGAGLGAVPAAAARLGGAVTGAYTDRLLASEDPEQARQAATLAGGVQAGLELVPVVGRGLVAGGRAVADATSPMAKWVGAKAANVIGGVEDSNFLKYIANRDRINAAGAADQDAVKDAVDQGVAGVLSDRDALAGQAGAAEDALNAAYAQKQADLAGKVTPLAKAKEMSASLEAQKGYLGSLSEQADDALVRSGATFQKSDLLDAIDKIGTGQGAAIGDEAHTALTRLQATRDRIQEQLPDQIPAAQMRDVLQQLRKDVNFDMGSGDFNDTLNGMRKEFSGQISDALKKQVPEYADYMSRMSDLADNLGTMNRYFGTETKALGSLEALRKGGARAQLIEDALQNHAQVNADQSLLQHLDDLRQNQALLDRIKGGEDLRQELFPDDFKALQEAQANAQMGQDVAAPIERLGQNRTQAVIRNQGGKIPNVEDRRALEALSEATGENYPQMIEDKNVFDSFGKASPGGARRAAAGGAVGAAVAHTLGLPVYYGAAAGSALGGTLDRYGPAVTKGTIDAGAGLLDFLASRGADIGSAVDALPSGNIGLIVPPSIIDQRNAIQRRIGH